MDSNRLRYFLAVSETGSIRKAAETLRLSPAALSKAIKLLEQEAGLTLVVPAGRGIAITDEGKELAKRALPILTDLGKLASGIRNETRDASLPIRIGSFEVFTTHFLSTLLDVVPKDSSLLLRELIPGEMEKALIAREIDLGITYIPIPTAGIDHLKVATIQMGIYARRGTFDRIPFSEIPFVVPVQPLSGTPNKVQGLDGWPDGKVSRQIRYRVTLMESAMELCRNGAAVAYLPSFVVALHNRSVKKELSLHSLPLPKGMNTQSQPVYIVRRKSDPENLTVRQAARVLREVTALG